jgi:hypothetical protein
LRPETAAHFLIWAGKTLNKEANILGNFHSKLQFQ